MLFTCFNFLLTNFSAIFSAFSSLSIAVDAVVILDSYEPVLCLLIISFILFVLVLASDTTLDTTFLATISISNITL